MSVSRILTLLMALIFALQTILVQAQDDTSKQRIAVIDVQRALKKSQFVRDALAEQDRKIKNLQNQIDGMLMQYERLRGELTRQASVLSESQLNERKLEITDLRDSIKNKQDEVKELLKALEEDMLTPYIREVVEAAKILAQEENYDLVLSREVVLYARTEDDLTDEAAVLLEEVLQKNARETSENNDDEEEESEPDKPKLTPTAPPSANAGEVDVLAARIRIGKGETLQAPYVMTKTIDSGQFQDLMIKAQDKEDYLNKTLNRTISKGEYILKPLLD